MTDKRFLMLTPKQWDVLELGSASIVLMSAIREAADTVGRRGIAGRFKNKSLVKYSRLGLDRETWTTLNTISIVAGAFLTVKFTYQQFKDKGVIKDKLQNLSVAQRVMSRR